MVACFICWAKLCTCCQFMYIAPFSPYMYISSQSRICSTCGSIISPILEKSRPVESALSHVKPEWKCCMCGDMAQINIISVPYVFRYLVAELAAMNIRVKMETK